MSSDYRQNDATTATPNTPNHRAVFCDGGPSVPDYLERYPAELYAWCRARGYRLVGGSAVESADGEWICNVHWSDRDGNPIAPPADIPADIR